MLPVALEYGTKFIYKFLNRWNFIRYWGKANTKTWYIKSIKQWNRYIMKLSFLYSGIF